MQHIIRPSYIFFSMRDLAGNFYVVPRNIIISLILLRILRTDKIKGFFTCKYCPHSLTSV